MQSLATNQEKRCPPAAKSLKCVPRSPGGGYVEFQVGDLVIVKIILGRFTTRAEWLREQNNTGIRLALAIDIFMLTSQARDKALLPVKARDTEQAGLLHQTLLHLDFPGFFMNRLLRCFGLPEQRQVFTHTGVG